MIRRPLLALFSLVALPAVACGGPSGTGGDEAWDAAPPVPASGDGGVDGAPGSDESVTGTGPSPEGQAPDGGDAGPDQVAPPACPGSALPKDNPCIIAEAFGVFAAPGAAAAGDGTRGKPFASIQAAITAAKIAGKRVYACAGAYAEPLDIQNGISVFGYFDCAGGTWSVGASRARIASPTSPAARATNITIATRIEGVDVLAPDFGGMAADPASPAKSSIGLLATNASALTVTGATIHAGTAQRGANGVDAVQLVQTSASLHGGVNEKPGFYNVCIGVRPTDPCGPQSPAQGGMSVCKLPGGATAAPGQNGGPGGSGGEGDILRRVATQIGNSTVVVWATQFPPGDGAPATAETAAGASSVTGALAQPGALRSAGASGTTAAGIGALSPTGYAPADGSAGEPGKPGQGGGGGLGGRDSQQALRALLPSSEDWFFGRKGTGGGAGGCAGLAGTAGRGGGASIAVLASNSTMRLASVTFETSAAGAAGRGGAGTNGTAGGAAGRAVDETEAAGIGKPGSAGSAGGAGGSGRGGASIGLAYTGGMPIVTIPTHRLGAAGAGAPSFTSATGTVAASPAGVQAQTQSF